MKNQITQFLSSIPAITLAIAALSLAFSVRKFRETGFFVVGIVLSVLSMTCNVILWSIEPDAKMVSAFFRTTNVIFSAQSALYFCGAIQWLLATRKTVEVRQNVFGLIVLSAISLGAFVPYWYIRTHAKFQISNHLVVIFVLLWMPSFVMHIYLYSDPSTYRLIPSLATDLVLGIVGIMLAFNVRAQLLSSNEDLDIDPILTFFFGVFYLQYKINELRKVEIDLNSTTA